MMGMLVKREGLWFKILIAKYGMEDGRILGGCSKVSRWWRDLNCVRGGGCEYWHRWFDDTIFWKDKWLADVIIGDKCERFYELFLDENILLAEMFKLELGICGDGGDVYLLVFS
jgi:hypothetical protein